MKKGTPQKAAPAGKFTQSAPQVSPEDQIFTTVDLMSWTLGLSGSIKKFSFSAGIHQRSGTANDIVVRNLVSGQGIHTSSDIRTTGIIYSVSYQF